VNERGMGSVQGEHELPRSGWPNPNCGIPAPTANISQMHGRTGLSAGVDKWRMTTELSASSELIAAEIWSSRSKPYLAGLYSTADPLIQHEQPSVVSLIDPSALHLARELL